MARPGQEGRGHGQASIGPMGERGLGGKEAWPGSDPVVEGCGPALKGRGHSLALTSLTVNGV